MRYYLFSFVVLVSWPLFDLQNQTTRQAISEPESFTVSRYWDLSYKSLLEKYDIRWDHQDGTLFTWLENDPEEQKQVRDFVEQPLQEKVQSSFLIEHPTLPDGGRLTVWGVQTEKDTYFWLRSSKQGPRQFKKYQLTREKYDTIFKRLTSLKQKSTFEVANADQSFAGFLSIYHGEQSNQLLLHVSDFLEIDPESNETIGWGTIYQLEANELKIKF